MEGIACRFALTLRAPPRNEHQPDPGQGQWRRRRSSTWWLQLEADLTGLAGRGRWPRTSRAAFGAAILAGVGAGVYPSVSAAVDRLVAVGRRFEPDPGRAQLYADVRARLAASQP